MTNWAGGTISGLPSDFFFTTSNGGHNGPTLIEDIGLATPSDMWQPNLGNFAEWTGTSTADVTSGLQFSILITVGSSAAPNFQDAVFEPTPVSEPGTLGLLGIALAGLYRARQRNRGRRVGAEAAAAG